MTAAYRQTIAELDDLYPLRAGLERNQLMPKNDPVRAGEASSGNFLEGLWKDFRYALRSMRKNPVFVLFVVLTLALGIGANTTVFTLINTVVLNPLPVRNPDQLAALDRGAIRGTPRTSGSIFPVSYADLKDYQSRNEVFDSLAGYSSARGMTWLNHGASEAVFGELVTANYFATLGLTPGPGTLLLAGGGRRSGRPPRRDPELCRVAETLRRRGGRRGPGTGGEQRRGDRDRRRSTAFHRRDRHLRSRSLAAGGDGRAHVSRTRWRTC